MTSLASVSDAMLQLVWFLLRYWAYDFDECCNILARIDTKGTQSEPDYKKYSKYQLDGYIN